MKKITLFFLFILIAGFSIAQYRQEYYYPEKNFISNYVKATTPEAKIDAGGHLAMYYMLFCKDSLVDVYINKIFDIAAATFDPALIVKAKWWDAYVHSQSISYDETEYVITAANDLLSYAEKYHFLDYKISAYTILSYMKSVSFDLKESEKDAITASLWLEDIQDDSLRMEVYFSLAHIFISEKDGISASRYLLKIRNYSEQEGNETIRIQAIRKLAELYNEMGEFQKAILCDTKLIEYYAKKKMIYCQVGTIGDLMGNYMGGDDNKMKKYFGEKFQKLQDSLNIVNFFTFLNAYCQWNNGWLATDKFIKLLKSNFGNRFCWPKAALYADIAGVYIKNAYYIKGYPDSVKYYLDKAKLNGVEKLYKPLYSYNIILGYLFMIQGKYTESIKVFSEMRATAKKDKDIIAYNYSLQRLIDCYEYKQDYKTANRLIHEYDRISDSLEKLNNKQVITMMEVEKDKEINDRKQKESEAKLEHRHNIQYMGMALGAIAIIIILILLGIINAKPWVIRSMSFFSFIFIFEFIILVLDKQINYLTGGEPWKIILIKVFIIAVLFPLHHFIENKVSHNLIHKDISPGKWIKTLWGSRLNKPEE